MLENDASMKTSENYLKIDPVSFKILLSIFLMMHPRRSVLPCKMG